MHIAEMVSMSLQVSIWRSVKKHQLSNLIHKLNPVDH